MNLKNKVIIITGSTRGIGFGIAEEAIQAGANVVISGRSQERIDQVIENLELEDPNQVLGIECEITNIESCQQLIKKTLDKFEKIDILVNNAGITKDNLLLRMKESEWDDVIQTNLNSIFYLTKSVCRPMIKKKSGKIINISSIVGLTGNSGQANYAATKAGIIGFTKSIAKELGSKGITCNAIAPGFIDTDMIDSLPEEYINNIISNIPLKRLGNTQDISKLVLFLASDLSNYITGQIFSVDGGMNM